MKVSNDHTVQVLQSLGKRTRLGLDTETYGLAELDRLFAIIISDEQESYYFNFAAGPDHLGGEIPSCMVLSMDELRPHFFALFGNPQITWYIHNAKFDMQKLLLEGFLIAGAVHCTMAMERLLDNTAFSLALDVVAPKYGFQKSSAVDSYRKKHRVSFHEVPFAIMSDYGLQDGRLAFDIGQRQERELSK
jgi:DNA polymerase I-like protein with 3'-5' exonuclease and polymerase domains